MKTLPRLDRRTKARALKILKQLGHTDLVYAGSHHKEGRYFFYGKPTRKKHTRLFSICFDTTMRNGSYYFEILRSEKVQEGYS